VDVERPVHADALMRSDLIEELPVALDLELELELVAVVDLDSVAVVTVVETCQQRR